MEATKFKITFNQVIKIIHKHVENLEGLYSAASSVFSADLSSFNFYYQSGDDLKLLSNNSDFSNLISLARSSNLTAIKLVLLPINKEIQSFPEENKKESGSPLKSALIFESNQEVSIEELQKIKDYGAEEVVFNEGCTKCETFPILKTKFICLLCNDVVLCSKCENQHSHPLMKIKTQEHSSIDEVARILEDQYEYGRKGIFSGVPKRESPNFLESIFSKKIYKLRLEGKPAEYQVSTEQFFEVTLRITNTGNMLVPKGSKLMFRNMRELNFSPVEISEEINVGESIEINSECFSGEKSKKYFVDAFVFSSTVEIENEVCQMKIHVDVDGKFCEFDPKDKVSILNTEKKKVLMEMITKDKRNRSVEDILEQLEELDWDSERLEENWNK